MTDICGITIHYNMKLWEIMKNNGHYSFLIMIIVLMQYSI